MQKEPCLEGRPAKGATSGSVRKSLEDAEPDAFLAADSTRRLALENQPQSKLHHPGAANRVEDLPEIGDVHASFGVAKLTLLKTLKISHRNSNARDSLMVVFLARLTSKRFCRGEIRCGPGCQSLDSGIATGQRHRRAQY